MSKHLYYSIQQLQSYEILNIEKLAKICTLTWRVFAETAVTNIYALYVRTVQLQTLLQATEFSLHAIKQLLLHVRASYVVQCCGQTFLRIQLYSYVRWIRHEARMCYPTQIASLRIQLRTSSGTPAPNRQLKFWCSSVQNLMGPCNKSAVQKIQQRRCSSCYLLQQISAAIVQLLISIYHAYYPCKSSTIDCVAIQQIRIGQNNQAHPKAD